VSELMHENKAGRRLPSVAGLPAGSILLALNILAGLVVFWFGIVSLLEAWSTPEYSHGPIIPLLSAFMFMREMKSVPAVAEPVRDRWVGVGVVLIALAIGVIGGLIQIPDIVTYALILWIGGTILACFGLRRGWYFWPSVLHLVFMLPLPYTLYWPLSIWLQMVSSEIGVSIIRFADIPVFLDGNIIDLGVYQLQVAEACSGLRYLFPVMSFSYVFGVLYTGPLWHKLVLLLSAAPITVMMNSVRIGIIGIMVDNFGIGYAEGFLHFFEGWVIFIGCVVILFGLAAVMQKLSRDPRLLGESIDIDFDGLPAQAARFTRVPATGALIAVAVMTAGSATALQLMPNRVAAEIERTPLGLFPDEVAGYRGQSRVLEPDIERVLGADDYLAKSFWQEGSPPIELFVAFYEDQAGTRGIHSPQVCLPAGGWEVAGWRQDTVALDPSVPGEPQIRMNRAVIQKGQARQLVIYWLEQRGRRVANDFHAKLITAYDSITRGRDDGALVRLTTPILRGETPDMAEDRLRRFIGAVMAHLPEHVPE